MICGVRYRSGSVRSAMISSGKEHKRTPEIAASIVIGWETFLSFAEEVGALSREEAITLLERARSAILGSGRYSGRTSSERGAGRPLPRLLGAAISSGRAHVTAATCARTSDADRWGWQLVIVGTGSQEREDWQPRGERIGWLDADDLFLDPESLFAAVQKLRVIRAPACRSSRGRCGSASPSRAPRRPRPGSRHQHRAADDRRAAAEVIHLKASTFAIETDQPSAATAQTDQQSAEKAQQNRASSVWSIWAEK